MIEKDAVPHAHVESLPPSNSPTYRPQPNASEMIGVI